MKIQKCTLNDVPKLAEMNKHLIEDEKINNTMNILELEKRIKDFLITEYDAYFFIVYNETVGYALVRNNSKSFYLRQFFIKREYRNKHSGIQFFGLLLQFIYADFIDIEVFPWNEPGKNFWKKCGFVLQK